jgi:BirA family biotin operon repressor/biotin-[acetyl-CoA-carboxylase] ligase
MYAQMAGLSELPALNATRFSQIRFVEETGSTNADLLIEAERGGAEGLVLVTDHQTAGRGRQSREWHDEPGCSLLVSLLLRPAPTVAPLIPLLAGVAAAEALLALAGIAFGADGSPLVGLKWPNDVLAPTLGERKLAGILAEASSVGSGSIVVVTGMGMNLRRTDETPAEIEAKAATVEELLGPGVDRRRVLDTYLRAFEYWLQQLDQGGASRLLARYRDHCLTIGRRVRFVTTGNEHVGTVIDVSDSGTLLLRTSETDVVELYAGDAHHVPL